MDGHERRASMIDGASFGQFELPTEIGNKWQW
jgi:hypothetical protein